jgi:hypothetical protein
MNVKRAPITTFCVLLALVCYSLDVREHSWAYLAPGVAHTLPTFLAVCTLVLAFLLFILFERFHGTHHHCPESDVASLPLWAELKSRTSTRTPPLTHASIY